MTANAWGEEPNRSRRFWNNHVRAAISPSHPSGHAVSAGLFNEHGADESRDCLKWVSHEVPTLIDAGAIVDAALRRDLRVWSMATAELIAALEVRR